ncbi:response regulator transcription factor [Seleniivibrio sp.]|uniref:response regulator transcription factor n=1 Tax=Seleniivibrio sp. TaxID=2898801 RepID=UPI0025E8C297|nr:response regulator transcription factor [Seleniivibrio sp.]MCD8554612.1 response regulator transcription factor [Seleniivibrio sp.]
MIIAISCDRNFCRMVSDTFGQKETVSVGLISSLRDRHEIASNDVAILDLPYLTPTEITKIPCKVVILTSVPKFEEALKMLKMGIKAYGNRMMHPDNMKQMVTAVRTGQIWLPPDIVSRLITALPADNTPLTLTEELSERETEVAKLVAKGKSNQEIADTLDITVRTVKAHLTSIFSKTGLRDRLALALHFK